MKFLGGKCNVESMGFVVRAQGNMQAQCCARTSVIADSPLVLGVDDCRGLRACGSSTQHEHTGAGHLPNCGFDPTSPCPLSPTRPTSHTCSHAHASAYRSSAQRSRLCVTKCGERQTRMQNSGAKVQNTSLRSLHWGHRINQDCPC